MAFKFGGEKGYTPSADGDGDGERWIKNFKDGETIIRFLEQMEDWTPYWEHYDAGIGEKGAYFPCTGNRRSCPGCTSEVERTSRASKRYLVNAKVGDYVDLYKVPKTVADQMDARVAKDEGDATKREYSILRSGKAPQIDYDVDREERDPIDVEQYRDKFQDHQEALQSLWKRAFGDLEPDSDDNQDTEQPAARPARQPRTARTERSKPDEPVVEPENQLGDPPSEPQPAKDQVAEADDEVELSEEALRAMSAAEVKGYIAQAGIQADAPDTEDVDVLVDYMLKVLA